MNTKVLPRSLRTSFQALLGLSCLLWLAGLVATAPGQTITNPSFEVDSVPPSPGYGAITSWR